MAAALAFHRRRPRLLRTSLHDVGENTGCITVRIQNRPVSSFRWQIEQCTGTGGSAARVDGLVPVASSLFRAGSALNSTRRCTGDRGLLRYTRRNHRIADSLISDVPGLVLVLVLVTGTRLIFSAIESYGHGLRFQRFASEFHILPISLYCTLTLSPGPGAGAGTGAGTGDEKGHND